MSGHDPVASESMLGRLRWLEPGVDIPAADRKNLAEILQGLQLLATDEARDAAAADQGWSAETPNSLQVIKAGTLAVTKRWTTIVAGAGGITAFLTLTGGIAVSAVSPLRDALGVPLAVSLIAGAVVIVAAAALSLALLIGQDLNARGVATAARHDGRARVAAEFLRATAVLPSASGGVGTNRLSLSEQLLLAAAAWNAPAQVLVDVPTKGIRGEAITGVRRLDGNVEIFVGNRDWVRPDEVTDFVAS